MTVGEAVRVAVLRRYGDNLGVEPFRGDSTPPELP
jgi:hypothetical protein